MVVAYGIRWKDTKGEASGRLTVGPDALRLVALAGEGTPLRELPFAAIGGLELRGFNGLNDQPILIFDLTDDGKVELESAVGKWILGDLLEATLRGMLLQEPARHRVLVSVKTRPESRAQALELLKAGPPFDPSATCITQHDVFVLDDQVLFLFETDDRIQTEESLMDAWSWSEPWRDLVVEVRDADLVYSWTRPAASEPVGCCIGLGF